MTGIILAMSRAIGETAPSNARRSDVYSVSAAESNHFSASFPFIDVSLKDF